MENGFAHYIISLGHSMGSVSISILFLLFLYFSILLLWRLYGKEGLYLYNIIAVIAANIQVLKIVPFFVSSEPVALGTILFSTTFLVSDILTEHHGKQAARLAISTSFIAQIFMTALMIITMMYPSDGGITGIDSNGTILDHAQAALYILFTPSIRILVASLVSYYIAQQIDVNIFKYMKDYTKKSKLWLRLNVSNLVAGFADNILFSVLAWVVLSPTPVTMHALIYTYILGTYISRIIVSVTSTPIIYLSYTFKPKEQNGI